MNTRQEFPLTLPCPLGGADMKQHLWLPRVWTQKSGRPFMVYWSDEIGYGLLHPTPTSDELSRFYEAGSYTSYLGGTNAGEPARRFSLSRRLLLRLTSSAEQGIDLSGPHLHKLFGPGRICEIGCASGVLLAELRDLGHDVYGIEPSAVGRQVATSRGLTVAAGTAEDPPEDCPFGTFDGVIMAQSLEHCLDPVRAVQNVFKLLRPGGWFVCDVPNADCARFEQSREVWFHADAGRHISYFTSKSLGELARKTGFVPESFSYNGYLRQFVWLENEQEIWDSLYGKVPASERQNIPPRPDELGLWDLARRTLFGAPARRYDSVRMSARKPAAATT